MKLRLLMASLFIFGSVCAEIPTIKVLKDREAFSARFLNTAFVPDGPIIKQYRAIVNHHCKEVVRTAKSESGVVGVLGKYELIKMIEAPLSSNKWQAESDILDQIDAVIAQVQSEGDIENEEYDRLKDAFLFKTTGVLVDTVVSEVLSMLDVIDTCYRYWVNQQGRPWHYFFHKSLHKWVMGAKQDDEIKSKIKYLAEYRKRYHIFLGRFIQYICMLDGNISTHQEIISTNARGWIRHLLDIVRDSVLSIPRREDSFSDYLILLKDMRNGLNQLAEVQDLLEADIVEHEAQKPGHLARNWIWYAGILGVAYCGAKSYHNNPAGIVRKIIDTPGQLYVDREKLLTDHVKSPLERAWNALWGGDGANNKKGYACDSVRIDYSKPDSYSNRVKELEGQYADMWGAASLARIVASFEQNLYRKTAPDVVDRLEDKHGKKLDNLLDALKLVAPLAGLMPATMAVAGAFYSSRGLYRIVTNRDYTPIRLALCDIEEILIRTKVNEYNEELYGELLHKLHGLRAKTQYLVPKTEGIRMQFMRQLYYLESVQFSSEDKRAFIHTMRERYQFLRAS